MSQRIERTGSLLTGLQAAANLATLIVACLLSIVLVKNYIIHGSGSQQPALNAAVQTNASLGNNLKPQFSDVDWSANHKTVILALSTHCHFCTESAPFFRRLSNKTGEPFKLIAVLPQTVAESQDYLNRQGVHVDQLKQMSLDKLGVAGTPTMLLLDKKGVVTRSWVGKLSPEEQWQALKAIGAKT